MPGLLDVASMIGAIGAAAVASTKEVQTAREEVRNYQTASQSASASVSGGTGSSGPSVGASSSQGNSPVTSRGMSAAISVARRSA